MKRAHFDACLTSDCGPSSPVLRGIEVWHFEDPKARHVFRPCRVSAVSMRHWRNPMGGVRRMQATDENPNSLCNHRIVEIIDLSTHVFALQTRIVILGTVNGNEKLWHSLD